jgi:hypothetical protein
MQAIHKGNRRLHFKLGSFSVPNSVPSRFLESIPRPIAGLKFWPLWQKKRETTCHKNLWIPLNLDLLDLRIFVAAISSNQVLYAEFSQTSEETHQANATASERKTLCPFSLIGEKVMLRCPTYIATNLSRKKKKTFKYLYMQLISH